MKLSNSESIVIQKPIGKDCKTTVGNVHHFHIKAKGQCILEHVATFLLSQLIVYCVLSSLVVYFN